MGHDEIYTNEQIIEVARKTIEDILTLPPSCICYHGGPPDWYSKGPLAWFCFFSKKHNPLGRFAIDIEALTTKQKSIIVNLVGEAIPKACSKYEGVGNVDFSQYFEASKYCEKIDGMSSREYQDLKEKAMIDTIFRIVKGI